MRAGLVHRVLFVSSLVLGMPLAIGCALDTEGQLSPDASLGGSGGSGGTTDAGLDQNTPDISIPECMWPNKECVACEPGEPCPPPPAPGGECVDFDNPRYGCAQDTCEPCDPGPNAEPGCLNSKCMVEGCNPGFFSCDGDPETGCETNIFSLENCLKGNEEKALACGNLCAPAHTLEATCAQGDCKIVACEPGWEDCNHNSDDGCETNLRTIEDCGECFKLCTVEAPSNPTCASGVCKPDVCPPGRADCDTNEQDCETDITTTSNCGSCGLVCSGPNVATWTCNDAGGVRTCQVVTCDPGWGNCDGDHANGCERDLRSSVDHCGACNEDCSTNNTQSRACNNSVCVPTCAAGFGNCDGNKPGATDNGCETNIRTLSNCGDCGVTCSRANATATCATGICSIASCNAGYGSCDGLDPNGCETNTNTTATHCGGCGQSCSGNNVPNPTCGSGVCNGACASGFGDCNGNKLSDGCETNTRTLTNCGGCGVACSRANATATCATGTCSIASCNSGYGNCDGQDANGCEINTTNTPNHCGSCGNQCSLANATSGCANSACTIASCNPGYGNCDSVLSNGCEINTANNPDHCGSCDNQCSLANATSGCANSACTIVSCNAGYGNCDSIASNGCEASTSTNTSHCGTCGKVCSTVGGTASCSGGNCSIACTAPNANCDGNVDNGCEVNTSNNPSHCGTCNKVCSSVGGTPSCNSGTCSISCTAPNANCDGNVDNGCEVNTSNTPAHCGGCNQACTSGFTCDTGVCKCTATSCQAGTCNSEGKCVCGTTTCSYNQTCTGSNCT